MTRRTAWSDWPRRDRLLVLSSARSQYSVVSTKDKITTASSARTSSKHKPELTVDRRRSFPGLVFRPPKLELAEIRDRVMCYRRRRRAIHLPSSHRSPLSVWTISSIRRAASPALSCAQTQTTRQPEAWRRRSVSASRARLVSIFSRQNCALLFGQNACFGQPCQKQPSTKIATLAPKK